MKRRNLLVVVGAAAFAPRVVFAQSKQPLLIGWLHGGSRQVEGFSLVAFKEGFAALGWKEGSNFLLEERWAEGQRERLQPLAEELAAKNPTLIVAGFLPATAAAANAAPKTPIVQADGGDPVATGLATSFSRPGGMITGVTNIVTQLSEKYLELLIDTVPNLRRVGFLFDTTAFGHAIYVENARRSAAQQSLDARFAEAGRPEEIEPALSRFAKEGVRALIVMPGAMVVAERRRIVKYALDQRWPTIAAVRAFPEEGALLSYSADRAALCRRAAFYVDRILKGAKPGDLPIEQPTKFELIVNKKTAKALGIKIPNSILLRADKVIE